MNKKGIVIGLIILSCTLLVVLIYILAMFSKQDNLQNDIANSEIINSIKDNNTTNNASNSVNSNNENIAQNVITQNTTGNANRDDNKEEIKNIKISIVNTPSDILDKISNKDDFAYCLKKLVYQLQKPEITQFEYVHNIRLNNKYIIYYRANDNIGTYIEVVYDLTTNKTTAEIAKD